jgi:AcrR family transcriptional regulator
MAKRSPAPASRGKRPAKARAFASRRKAATPPDNTPARRGRRKASTLETDARRQAILQAALEAFSRNGFAATRIEDVAARAGVAKGTVYLYFPNKETLFGELIRNAVTPVLARLEGAAAQAPPEQILSQMFELFRTHVLETDRKFILRLLIAEGPRFPAIAEFYHREVVSRGLRILRGAAQRAAAAGLVPKDTIDRFPQLIVAPLIVAVVWDSLFNHVDPLDVKGMLEAHARLLTGGARR